MTTYHNGPAPESSGRDHYHPTHDMPHGPAPTAHLARRASDGPARILLVNGAPRSDGSWTGEAAKTWRLTELARLTLDDEGVATEVLDLGLAAPEDADALRAQCLAANGIIVLAPAHGDALAGMREALAHCDGMLANRAYGIVVHGDMAAICHARGVLADWLDGLGLVDSDSFGPLTRFVGYYEPDEDGKPARADPDFEEEVRNVARAVHKAVTELRAGRLTGVTCAP